MAVVALWLSAIVVSQAMHILVPRAYLLRFTVDITFINRTRSLDNGLSACWAMSYSGGLSSLFLIKGELPWLALGNCRCNVPMVEVQFWNLFRKVPILAQEPPEINGVKCFRGF